MKNRASTIGDITHEYETSSVSHAAYPFEKGKTFPLKFSARINDLTRFMAGTCSLGPEKSR